MARYLIKFSKGKGIKFISHLDLLRSIQRAIRRSGIPISYSKGFNPHSEFSFATPLSVGTWSIGEYMEIKLDFEMNPEEILARVNDSLPEDIEFLNIVQVSEKFPAPMAVVEAASYEIIIVSPSQGVINQDIKDEFIKTEKIEVIKSGKKGEKVVDIKPMIFDISMEPQHGEELKISATVATGSRSNLNPELIVSAVRKYVNNMHEAEIRDIKKRETYVKKDGRFITLLELVESDYI